MDFETVVKMIKESNEKVDAVLKAAKLERHERPPMDFERLKFVLYFVAGMTAMVLGFVAAFMIIYLQERKEGWGRAKSEDRDARSG